MRSMEAVAVAASQQEPVLLVGETGTGKTTLVQHLAEQVSGTLNPGHAMLPSSMKQVDS